MNQRASSQCQIPRSHPPGGHRSRRVAPRQPTQGRPPCRNRIGAVSQSHRGYLLGAACGTKPDLQRDRVREDPTPRCFLTCPRKSSAPGAASRGCPPASSHPSKSADKSTLSVPSPTTQPSRREFRFPEQGPLSRHGRALALSRAWVRLGPQTGWRERSQGGRGHASIRRQDGLPDVRCPRCVRADGSGRDPLCRVDGLHESGGPPALY